MVNDPASEERGGEGRPKAMNEPPVLEPNPTPTGSSEPASYSVLARMVNVFAVPGDVFEDVLRSRPNVGNWLWPALLGALVGFMAGWLLWSQPAIRQAVLRQQEQALTSQVESGRLTRERADQALERIRRMLESPAMQVAAAGMAGLGGGVRFLAWAVALWGVGRWAFGAMVPFGRACEVAGLASLVGVLGNFLELMLWVPSEGSPGPVADPVSETRPAGGQGLTTMVVLQSVFGFWQVAVMSVGLSKLAGVPWVRGLWVLMGLWLFWMLALAVLGWAR